MEVYINDIAAFLPNEAVNNDEIEEVLGKIHVQLWNVAARD